MWERRAFDKLSRKEEVGRKECAQRRDWLDFSCLREMRWKMKILSAASLLILFACPIQAQQPASNPPPKAKMEQMHGGFMGEGMHHALAKGVRLEKKIDSANHTITLRVGPMTLPANTSHMKMPQPPSFYWTTPFTGWLLGYHPAMLDAKGEAVPGTLLHHVAFWNENRSDFLCPNKPEHIFGAGGELTVWQEIPGYGYAVRKGDRIRIDTMVYNPTDTSYSGVYFEVTIPYQEEASSTALKNLYPAWMDVASCGNSGYDLPAGPSSKTGTVTVKYDGVLLGVGGHMHNYAKQLVLEDVTKHETVATLDAKTDASGHLLSMPVDIFYKTGGFKFSAGDELKITATYDNTTGKLLPDGAMGIVVGYFVPTDSTALASLRHEARPMHHHMHHM
jgi:hypothetical protein